MSPWWRLMGGFGCIFTALDSLETALSGASLVGLPVWLTALLSGFAAIVWGVASIMVWRGFAR